MPRISLVVNTAAGDPRSAGGHNPFRSARYAERRRLLREEVLPAAFEAGLDEVLVAGVWEDGEGYRYVPVAPRRRDRADGLQQREVGARHATGDILVFSHDDHALGADFGPTLRGLAADPTWSLLVPRRVHAITGADLENGRKEGYMGGHVLVMRRWLWAAVPWTSVDTEFWDVPLTHRWRGAGGEIRFEDSLIHLDVEASAEER
jgi:hypothetical protein